MPTEREADLRKFAVEMAWRLGNAKTAASCVAEAALIEAYLRGQSGAADAAAGGGAD